MKVIYRVTEKHRQIYDKEQERDKKKIEEGDRERQREAERDRERGFAKEKELKCIFFSFISLYINLRLFVIMFKWQTRALKCI